VDRVRNIFEALCGFKGLVEGGGPKLGLKIPELPKGCSLINVKNN
jgi:hypothetical protein